MEYQNGNKYLEAKERFINDFKNGKIFNYEYLHAHDIRFAKSSFIYKSTLYNGYAFEITMTIDYIDYIYIVVYNRVMESYTIVDERKKDRVDYNKDYLDILKHNVGCIDFSKIEGSYNQRRIKEWLRLKG